MGTTHFKLIRVELTTFTLVFFFSLKYLKIFKKIYFHILYHIQVYKNLISVDINPHMLSTLNNRLV